ncbi:MAG: hypothetical protein GWP59_01030 [Chlamydiales bacterium]|nr:hypothetical protein [Chlamydiales bacterium]
MKNTYMRFDKIPDNPASGIKKRWLPSIIRWPIKLLILPFIFLDTAMHRLARCFFKPPFLQTGACKKRGNCCYYILIPWHRLSINNIIQSFWMTQINGFFFREKYVLDDENRKWRVMGCRYLKKDGSCGHHFFRPTVCRKWPLIEGYATPRYLKGCGFKALARDERQEMELNQDVAKEKLKMYQEDFK